MHEEDVADLDDKVRELRRSGFRRPSRSGLIRIAISRLDVSRLVDDPVPPPAVARGSGEIRMCVLVVGPVEFEPLWTRAMTHHVCPDLGLQRGDRIELVEDGGDRVVYALISCLTRGHDGIMPGYCVMSFRGVSRERERIR